MEMASYQSQHNLPFAVELKNMEKMKSKCKKLVSTTKKNMNSIKFG
jgi:hypothetical protein